VIPPYEWPTPFRDFVTANPFAVLTPPSDAAMDGTMSWEPDSIDANANTFVQAVWYTTRRVGAVLRAKRKGPRGPATRFYPRGYRSSSACFWALVSKGPAALTNP
jgi:hypothetical protein